MPEWAASSLGLFGAVVLVILNGFFVAAEFAMVKTSRIRLDELMRQGRPFAKTARWLYDRMDATLSACQLGITMASLGLGWVGEPTVARLIAPALQGIGVTSEAVVHTIAFTVAFTLITAAHIVIGEQFPKIYAIRRPERVTLWCALPLKAFYLFSYPLMLALNSGTNFLLSRAGVGGGGEHGAIHSEDEIRAILLHTYRHGDMTRSEHRLLNAVFDFDDLICRRIMVPRVDVTWVDAEAPLSDSLERIRSAKHTRYPVCEGSLDRVVGVLHIKDLIGVAPDSETRLRDVMRKAEHVPETLQIGRLLAHFQTTRQLMAIVVDEYGTVAGIVTLENVLEQLVGSVEDEFDSETPFVQKQDRPADADAAHTPESWIVLGRTPLEIVGRELALDLASDAVDTFSGYLVAVSGKIPKPGDEIQLDGATARVLEVKGARATKVLVTRREESAPDAPPPADATAEVDPQVAP